MFKAVSASRHIYVTLILAIGLATSVTARPPDNRAILDQSALSVDNTTYINANKILMFVTNHGNFGRDMAGVFGNDYGTYYPYTSIDDIVSGVGNRSVNYASGIWLGGVDSATHDTLVTVSEYSSEYVPGPMAGGTFQMDRPEFRVYKLYGDSLESNPNADYIEWPDDQGAPVDDQGRPEMRGDQMLWTVYNDADPSVHDNNNGETAPMAIEVQQTFWASDKPGEIELPLPEWIAVDGPDTSTVIVTVEIDDNAALTGHDYAVVTDTTHGAFSVWHLIDLTTGDTLLADQLNLTGDNTVVTDGFLVQVVDHTGFRSFEVVANAAGPIDPPESAAAPWEDFPVPTGVDLDGFPTENQQVGEGHWMISTGSAGYGTDRGPYEVWLERTLRGTHNWVITTGKCASPARTTIRVSAAATPGRPFIRAMPTGYLSNSGE